MEGLLNGKKGLFPDNFVEMLPMENVKSEPGLPAPNNINGQKSVKRAAKQDPIAEPEKVHHTEKPKHMVWYIFSSSFVFVMRKEMAGFP